jgi:hypothetical protein
MKPETDDPIKSKLLMKTARYREDLEEDTKLITERTESIIKNALIVGGALALTYFAYQQLAGSKNKKSKVKVKKVKKHASVAQVEDEDDEVEASAPNQILSQIGTALVSQASVFLLSMAKEKLAEYLQAQAEKKKA